MFEYQIFSLLEKRVIPTYAETTTLRITSAQLIINLVCWMVRLTGRILVPLYSSVLQKASNATQEHSVGEQLASSIPVVISENRSYQSASRGKGPSNRVGYNDRNLNELDEGDGDFETFIRRRTQRLYLGGFQANVTERTILKQKSNVLFSWYCIYQSS